MTRKSITFIHEGRCCAEVPVELIEDDTAWSPYLAPADVTKLDTVRLALRAGNNAEAAKHRRVVELTPGGEVARRDRGARHAGGHRQGGAELYRAVPEAGIGAEREQAEEGQQAVE